VRQGPDAVHRLKCRWLASMVKNPNSAETVRVSIKTRSWPGYQRIGCRRFSSPPTPNFAYGILATSFSAAACTTIPNETASSAAVSSAMWSSCAPSQATLPSELFQI